MESTNLQQVIKPTFNLLKLTFGLVPIVAGLDKFTNLLTNWDQYINPSIGEMLPFSGHSFMMIVGVIEIVAGILVLKKRNWWLHCCRLVSFNLFNAFGKF